MDLYITTNVKQVAKDGSVADSEEIVLREHEISIFVNGQPVMKQVCIKQDLRDLVWGRLLTGGFIGRKEDVREINLSEDAKVARVELCSGLEAGNAQERNLKAGQERGRNLEVENKQERNLKAGREWDLETSVTLRKLPGVEYKPEWIFAMAEQFARGTVLHDMTSFAHSCMLARKGEIIYSCEDIGRHNAIDKAIGYALSSDIPLSECIIYTSGRAPVDMVEKVISAGVPIMVSKSIPTAEAIEVAKKYGLTLIGRARPDGYKVFN